MFLHLTCPLAGHCFPFGSSLPSPFLSYSESPWNTLTNFLSQSHLLIWNVFFWCAEPPRTPERLLHLLSVCSAYIRTYCMTCVIHHRHLHDTFYCNCDFWKITNIKKKWKHWPSRTPTDFPPLPTYRNTLAQRCHCVTAHLCHTENNKSLSIHVSLWNECHLRDYRDCVSRD